MYIEPSSVVKILRGVPLDVSHKNTIYFGSAGSQQTYFNSKVKYTLSNCSYIKEQRVLRVNRKADDLYDCNYLMFQNTSFGSKWFYAFISDVEYVNNETSYITFEIDHMQTWLPNIDYQIMPSFVEREHVTDDSIGANLIDEGLALGDFVTNVSTSKMFTDWWVVIGATVDIRFMGIDPVTGETAHETGYVYAGIYSGISWFCFDVNTMVTLWSQIMRGLAANGKNDSIVAMFMIPKDVVAPDQPDGGYLRDYLRQPEPFVVLNHQSLNGYIPRNKKLLTYPYRSLVVSNLDGSAIKLRYEFFEDNQPTLYYIGGIQPDSKIIVYPVNYKGVVNNYNESISLGGYPQCAWTKDVYAQWLANQTIRNNYIEERTTRNSLTNYAGGIIGSVSSPNPVAKGVGIGKSLASLVNTQLDMFSKMEEEKEVHSLIPPSVAGTVGNGNTNISIGAYGFRVESKSIKSEIAKSIDDYFDMYGYKVNRVKVPNLSTRPNWNYIKTIGVTIKGNIPADAMAVISAVYNTGVTFWKSGENVGNYNLNNSI